MPFTLTLHNVDGTTNFHSDVVSAQLVGHKLTATRTGSQAPVVIDLGDGQQLGLAVHGDHATLDVTVSAAPLGRGVVSGPVGTERNTQPPADGAGRYRDRTQHNRMVTAQVFTQGTGRPLPAGVVERRDSPSAPARHYVGGAEAHVGDVVVTAADGTKSVMSAEAFAGNYESA